MQGRRGGRIQVNFLQFMELTERVERLEAAIFKDNISLESDNELTKQDIKDLLDQQGISYTTKHTKEDLLGLLNEGN